MVKVEEEILEVVEEAISLEFKAMQIMITFSKMISKAREEVVIEEEEDIVATEEIIATNKEEVHKIIEKIKAFEQCQNRELSILHSS